MNIWEILDTMKPSDVRKQIDMVVAFNPNDEMDDSDKPLNEGRKQVKTIRVKNKKQETLPRHLR